MKLFQMVQENFAYLGISPCESCWNKKSAKAIYIFASFAVLGTVYLFFNATTFLEYTMNVYVTTAVFGTGLVFIAMLLQKERLFKLIEDLEKFVEESEYRGNRTYFKLCTSNILQSQIEMVKKNHNF